MRFQTRAKFSMKNVRVEKSHFVNVSIEKFEFINIDCVFGEKKHILNL